MARDAREVQQSIDSGTDRFVAEVQGLAIRFAVRYRVAGQEFWDNNGGADYRFEMGFGPSGEGLVVTRPVFPVQLVSAESHNYGCSSCVVLQARIQVQNLAYTKDVAIVYSVAGGPWHEKPATYLSSLSPHADQFTVQVQGTSIRYALRYRVAGQEFWDNNGGADYLFEL